MRKPTAPQLQLLLAAVANGGYATEGDVCAVRKSTREAVKRAAWMTPDYRIQESAREMLMRIDAIAYTDALAKVPPAHLAAPIRCGHPVPARMVPDGLIQFDVPAGRAENFIGYLIYSRGELRTIVDAKVWTGSDEMLSCTIYVSDGKGGTRYADMFSIEFACYGEPDGRPRFLLAEQELAAVQSTEADPDDDLFRMSITGGGKSNLVHQILTDIQDRADKVTAGVEIIEGRGFGDCPTIELTVDEARTALSESTNDKARSLLNTLMTAGRDDRLIIMDPKRPMTQHTNFTDVVAAADNRMRVVTAPNHGDAQTRLANLTFAGAMTGQDPAELTGPELAAARRGINPATFRRLYPAVDRIADGEDLLQRAHVVRDALVRDLTELGREPAVRTILGDVREAGYRVALFELRTNGELPERIRRGAFYLELALSAAMKGQRPTANRSISKAQVALA